MKTVKNLAGLTAVSSLVLALVSACGGGGAASDFSSPAGSSGNPAATAGAGAYALGAITGFGSIIVNGVRYDDSKAKAEHA